MIVGFDANVLMSAVATQGLCADVVNAALAEHRLVAGETVLAELRRVLRQKLRVETPVVNEMDAFLRLHVTVSVAAPVLEVLLRDASDRAVLAGP